MLRLLIYNFTLSGTGLFERNYNLLSIGKFSFAEDRRSKSLTGIIEEFA